MCTVVLFRSGITFFLIYERSGHTIMILFLKTDNDKFELGKKSAADQMQIL